ncbi:hypothetical protein F5148DRAFT_908167 [Russula earlei]|uniref:Uncharacterized protein n=1 Tax=Russula earlei TaxID=71964 RepID=A0ACC0UB18_9AGAM|nr:hypothetical protein F5148DRAFT_908167 [Russula earlei]
MVVDHGRRVLISHPHRRLSTRHPDCRKPAGGPGRDVHDKRLPYRPSPSPSLFKCLSKEVHAMPSSPRHGARPDESRALSCLLSCCNAALRSSSLLLFAPHCLPRGGASHGCTPYADLLLPAARRTRDRSRSVSSNLVPCHAMPRRLASPCRGASPRLASASSYIYGAVHNTPHIASRSRRSPLVLSLSVRSLVPGTRRRMASPRSRNRRAAFIWEPLAAFTFESSLGASLESNGVPALRDAADAAFPISPLSR